VTLDNFHGEDIQIAVYSELGQQVYSNAITNMNVDGYMQTSIDLTGLAEGVYYLQIISDGKTATKQVVIQ